MKKSMKEKMYFLLSVIGLLVAAASASACWLFVFHQRKCPKTLIKQD
ncbi:MAG: cyclic lactone autoinducer peptide [Clostridia bacterium]|nr:cyclic lactone autoinducer peptide [Clostridia bacterium]